MNADSTGKNVEAEFADIDKKGAWPLLFQHIRNKCLNYEYTCSEARKSENKNLNRYRDVSPYDHSRVVLTKGRCNYINANIVTMDRTHRRYILTQGPLPQTAGHFWLMVWEQNCKAVLMLNRVIEKNQVKCHQYWPLGAEGGVGAADTMDFTDVGLKVQHVSFTKASYFTTRTLRLTETETGQHRDILHFHYTHWPDFGVPQSPTAFLRFLAAVRRSGALDQNAGPPVVHCSAGIGRSGTFCLVDSCLLLIEEHGLDAVSVTDVLLEMRTYRMGLIQTPDQLRFSYQAIIEGARQQASASANQNDEDPLLSAPSDEDDSGEDSDEPPPLPPPRGESLSLANNHGSTDSSPDCDFPADKPLPFAPGTPATDEPPPLPARPGVPLPVDCDGDVSPPSSPEPHENNSSSDGALRRRAERTERKERVSAQVRDMKRKQAAAESWASAKRSLANPINIGLGIALLIGGGAMAYSYFTRV